MKALIKRKEEVAQGTLMVEYDLMGQSIDFKPGQYFFVTLPNLKYPDERGNRRHFSIIISPSEKGMLAMCTRLSESGFKKTLNELPIGSEVEVGPIQGAFILPEDTTRPLVFIAGGIGITPFMSMLKFIRERSTGYHITLIYSNRNQASTAFLQELQQLSQKIPNFKLVLSMTEDSAWTGENRKVDASFIKEYFPDVNSNFYMVVGPPPMVEALLQVLPEAGVSADNIKVEKFTGYA